jgi:hypothetical protein
MGIALTKEQVLALAPDDASAKAAAGLVSDSKWVVLGADDDAVWGECKGSGAKPYQTQVDLAALASRCSCPSRKFPCKHGLALLLLHAQGSPRFSNRDRPAWVNEWLSSRKEKAEKKERPAAPVDPAATAATAAKRESTRWRRIESGTGDLQRWIADQFRNGLGKFGPEQRKEWTAMAARMVDAQAPGLGQQLEAALDAMDAGSNRYEEAIERLGLLQLINEGVARRETLSPSRVADLRGALGWSYDKDEVGASADSISDEWLVLGQFVIASDERLSERRVWLRGAGSGRFALLQDYAYNGRSWEGSWADGASYNATLAFYPGTMPLRAIARDQSTAPRQPWPDISPKVSVDNASNWFSQNPWLPHVPMYLRGATALRSGEGWQLQTEVGTMALRINDSAGWSLLAFGGGHPVHVMGEWDGRGLLPLSAYGSGEERWSINVDGVSR